MTDPRSVAAGSPRRRQYRKRRALAWAALTAAAAVGWSPPVRAQNTATIILNKSDVDRQREGREDELSPQTINAINYNDCVADDVLTFHAGFDGNVNDVALEVWVGQGSTDCTDADNRDLNASNTCWRVLSLSSLKVAGVDIPVRAQDVASRSAEGQGTASGCETTQQTDITFYFLLTQSSDILDSDTFTTRLDTRGQAPPGGVTATPGDGRAVVSWDSSEDDQITGYRVFCSDGTENVAPPAVAADAGPAPAPADPSCTSSILLAGQRPPTGLDSCASAGRDQTRTYTGKRSNGVSLAIGVSTLDDVGNVGPLSQISCTTPIPIDGFFDLYTSAGGKGGGGFCGLAATAERARAPGLLLISLGGLCWFGRRRRRKTTDDT